MITLEILQQYGFVFSQQKEKSLVRNRHVERLFLPKCAVSSHNYIKQSVESFKGESLLPLEMQQTLKNHQDFVKRP